MAFLIPKSPRSMPIMKIVAVFVAILCLSAVFANARKFSSSSMKTKNNWQYVAKFCFNGSPAGTIGHISWNVPTPDTRTRQLLLYWDQPDRSKTGSWEQVWKNDKLTCAEKASYAASGGAINLYNRPGGETNPLNHYPHFWWAVIADCNSTNGQNLAEGYNLEFVNHGGSQLSCDEQGLPAMYIVFFTFFLFLVAAHVYSAFQLFRTESLHPIIRLVTVCVGFQFWSMMFYMIYYTSLQRNGVAVVGVRAFADLFNMAMDLSMILLIILVSKGWAVTTNVIPKRDTAIILVTMALLIIMYLALFIWDYVSAGSPIVYYFYQSAPGVIVLVIRVLVAFWFFWNIFQTLKLETLPEKRSFYVKWVIIFGSWLCLLPLIVLIVGTQHVWVRLKAISALSETIDFIVLLALIIMTWPSLARRYFSVMPGKTLLGYDFLSGETSAYTGARFEQQENPFGQPGDL